MRRGVKSVPPRSHEFDLAEVANARLVAGHLADAVVANDENEAGLLAARNRLDLKGEPSSDRRRPIPNINDHDKPGGRLGQAEPRFKGHVPSPQRRWFAM